MVVTFGGEITKTIMRTLVLGVQELPNGDYRLTRLFLDTGKILVDNIQPWVPWLLVYDSREDSSV
jgi:hypothetical protein